MPMRYREALVFPIILRRGAHQPLHEQIVAQAATAIETGAVRPGTRLPSTRCLAEQIGVSRGVAAQSYDLLYARGYLVRRSGSGTFVKPDLPAAGGSTLEPSLPPWAADFRPDQPSTDAFPIRAWRTAWRQASHQLPEPAEPPPLGLPVLRQAVGEHLNRTRGIASTAHDVVITPGTAAGLRLLAEVLGPGLAVEQPLPRALLRAAMVAGPPATMPLDDEGARLDTLPAGIRAAVLCPDGNRPLGTFMSAARREQTARWGRHRLIIEIAREGAHRPSVATVPRLLDLAARTVILGDFAGLLPASLGLGYALVPRELAAPIGALIADRGEQPLVLTQLAVTQLLTDGTLARQARRLVDGDPAQRAIVRELLAPVVGPLEPGEVGAVLIAAPDGMTGRAAADALSRAGVRLPSLDSYALAPQRPTLVLGFGHLTELTLRRGLAELSGAWATVGFATPDGQSGSAQPRYNRFPL